MPHFYINPKDIIDNKFTVTGEQFHYLAAVRRFKTGDEINVFDGLGNSFLAKIISADKKSISGEIVSKLTFILPEKKVFLYTAVPKGERFEWLIEKCAEIGISKIFPLVTSRSSIKEISENKFARYAKISVAASSQCNRADIMPVGKMVDFKDAADFVSKQENSINIIPWECEESNTIDDILQDLKTVKSINIFIGPEGGFDKNETEYAFKNKILPVTLGKNILRIETACLAASVLAVNKI